MTPALDENELGRYLFRQGDSDHEYRHWPCTACAREIRMNLLLQVYIPPVDKEALLRELDDGTPECFRDACKAVVDDTYLGYLAHADLQALMEGFASGCKLSGQKAERSLGAPVG